MDWIQVLTIIATLLGAFMYLHNDLKNLKDEIHSINARIDQKNARIDTLYQMFVDLLRNRNTP